MNTEYVNAIRESLSMEDVAYHYVPNARIRNHRMPCPFHNGEDDNFALYDNSYYCYVCHEHGDIFTFTQKILGVNFPDALKALNQDFGLNLPIEGKLTMKQRIHIDYLTAVREEEREARHALEREYAEIMDKYVYYDRLSLKETPGSELWALAQKNKTIISSELDYFLAKEVITNCRKEKQVKAGNTGLV